MFWYVNRLNRDFEAAGIYSKLSKHERGFLTKKMRFLFFDKFFNKT